MSLEVRLRLLSDAAPGSGAAGPDVDREVVLDADGWPVIPGRRLKGLLREACQEVQEAFTLAGQAPWRQQALLGVDLLFGRPERAGLVRVGDAVLTGLASEESLADGERLRAWLAWAGAGADGRLFRPEAVLEQLTVVRRQTAVDPTTGAAREHALRSARLLRRGLCFAGPLTLLAGDPKLIEQARQTLALGCAALRQLGSARHRGPGRVSVRLWDSRLGDLTARELTALETPAGGGKR